MTKSTTWGNWSDWDTQWGTAPSAGGPDGPKMLHLGLLANGWADYTASTTNPTPYDYDAPVLNNLDQRYRTYYKNDSLHSTLPIWLLVGWYRRYNSGQGYYGTSMQVYVGSQINAAGVPLNANPDNHYYNNYGKTNATYLMPTLFTSGPSYSGFSLPQVYTRTAQPTIHYNFGRHLMVSRTVDSAGDPTAEGFFAYTTCLVNGSGVLNTRVNFHGPDPVAPFAVSDQDYLRKMTLNLGARTTSPAGAVQAYRVQAVTPTKTFVDENVVITPLDMEWPTTFKATPGLTEHTYIPIEDAAISSYAHGRVDSSRLAFRWE